MFRHSVVCCIVQDLSPREDLDNVAMSFEGYSATGMVMGISKSNLRCIMKKIDGGEENVFT